MARWFLRATPRLGLPLVALLVSHACDGGGPRVYTARLYRPAAGCLEPYAPSGLLEADRHELFRGISGRRSLAQVGTWVRDGDLGLYASVISPYPLAS